MAYVDSQDGEIRSELVIAEDMISTKVSQGDLDSAIEQSIDNITLSVNNGEESSTLTLRYNETVLDSANIRFTGVVTFDSLQTAGQTVINGANITTGTISADRIATNISQVSNTLTVGGSSSELCNIYFGVRGSSTRIYSDSRLDGELRIETSQDLLMTAKNDGNVEIWANGEGFASLGSNDGYTQVNGERVHIISNGGSRDTSGTDYVQINNVLSGFSSLRPRYDDDLNLGTSSYRWSQVYAATSTISTSDRNKKKDISYDLSKYDKLFDSLMPASFKMKDGSSGRTHIGLIAQDVEASLASHGLTAKEFAAFCKDQKEDEFGPIEGYDYALRYEEFIGLLIRQIQMLKERVKVLEDARN